MEFNGHRILPESYPDEVVELLNEYAEGRRTAQEVVDAIRQLELGSPFRYPSVNEVMTWNLAIGNELP